MRRNLKRKWRRFRLWVRPYLLQKIRGIKQCPYKQIPIVINNYNRLETLQVLLDGLVSRGYTNIHIIDNASTYPPLLSFYDSCPFVVHRLDRNVGHLSLWETGLYKQFWGGYVAYTDSDLEIDADCPNDFMEYFVALLERHKEALKVGFSIHIDDLPDCFSQKEKVVEWEKQFWVKEIEPGAYQAQIDTTFALYKPYFKGEIVDWSGVYIRVAPPYAVRHLPWYQDSNNLTPEERYYLSTIKTSTHWSEQEASNKNII